MTTGCLEFEADLSALLDGELSPERAALVRAHTGSCERCRAQLAQLARLDALLVGVPAPAVPASLRPRLEARLAVANESGPCARASAPRPPRRAWRGRAAGAAAALAAGVTFYLAVASREPAPQQGEPSPVQIARPLGEPSPAVPQLARRPEPAQPEPAAAPLDLESVPDEDLDLALELDTVEDFEVIANLELLELMLEAEAS